MPKYDILRQHGEKFLNIEGRFIVVPNIEIIAVVESPSLDKAVHTFFKQTSQILPGVWAAPTDPSIDTFVKDPPFPFKKP